MKKSYFFCVHVTQQKPPPAWLFRFLVFGQLISVFGVKCWKSYDAAYSDCETIGLFEPWTCGLETCKFRNYLTIETSKAPRKGSDLRTTIYDCRNQIMISFWNMHTPFDNRIEGSKMICSSTLSELMSYTFWVLLSLLWNYACTIERLMVVDANPEYCSPQGPRTWSLTGS